MAELELGFGVAVIGGLAIPRGGLRVAERDALARVVEVSQLLLSFGKVLGGSESIPVGSFCVALRDAFTFAIHEAEVVLRPGEVAVSSALAPCESIGEVVGCIVSEAEVSLRIRVALFGGLKLPVGGLGIVLRETLTGVVHRAEKVLRLGMALLGSESKRGCRPAEVSGVIVGDSLPVVRVGGCVGGIPAAAGDDAGASRGMERQRAAGRDVLQAGLGSILHAYFPSLSSKSADLTVDELEASPCVADLLAQAGGELGEEVAVFARGGFGVEMQLGDFAGEERVTLSFEGGDVALRVQDLARDAEKLGSDAFASDGGVDFEVIVKQTLQGFGVAATVGLIGAGHQKG